MVDVQLSDTSKVLLKRLYGYYYEAPGLFTKSIRPVVVTIDNKQPQFIGVTYIDYNGLRNAVVLCNPMNDVSEITVPAIYSDDTYRFTWIINSFALEESIKSDPMWTFGSFVIFKQVKREFRIPSTKAFDIQEITLYDIANAPSGTSRIIGR